MRKVKIGDALVSGLCIGGNPFSGFSHQTPERSRRMVAYYTPARIVETLAAAERVGINTFVGRTDEHILGIIAEYRKTGGAIQWFAQVSFGLDEPARWEEWLARSVEAGATGAYIHGGVVDYWYANGMFDEFHRSLAGMRRAGVVAGFAGHKPEAHEWIRDNLEVDFQMCSHYNPTDRSLHPEHVTEGEQWLEEDRRRMLEVIATIAGPVVHYKVFAGGNRPVIPAFDVLGKAMRPVDVVCVGIFTEDDPEMISRDVALFEEYVEG